MVANTIKIQGKTVSFPENYLDRVTYVPIHAYGNAGHEDCEQGVIVELRDELVMVLYSKSRSVQATAPANLVWG